MTREERHAEEDDEEELKAHYYLGDRESQRKDKCLEFLSRVSLADCSRGDERGPDSSRVNTSQLTMGNYPPYPQRREEPTQAPEQAAASRSSQEPRGNRRPKPAATGAAAGEDSSEEYIYGDSCDEDEAQPGDDTVGEWLRGGSRPPYA